jgi:hypothetical protein
MPVDSFKYLPRLLTAFYQTWEQEPELPIPWTPLRRPVTGCVFGLVTSAGLYHRPTASPFDVERERREPTWGDPTYRAIPAGIQHSELGVSHLHINADAVSQDINVLLPVHRFRELADLGEIGGLAHHAYSFMGFQGFPPDTTSWREVYGPEVAEGFAAMNVDCVLLTPA